MLRKLSIGLATLFALSVATSWTGVPAAIAIFIWTVAIPYMEQLQ